MKKILFVIFLLIYFAGCGNNIPDELINFYSQDLLVKNKLIETNTYSNGKMKYKDYVSRQNSSSFSSATPFMFEEQDQEVHVSNLIINFKQNESYNLTRTTYPNHYFLSKGKYIENEEFVYNSFSDCSAKEELDKICEGKLNIYELNYYLFEASDDGSIDFDDEEYKIIFKKGFFSNKLNAELYFDKKTLKPINLTIIKTDRYDLIGEGAVKEVTKIITNYKILDLVE